MAFQNMLKLTSPQDNKVTGRHAYVIQAGYIASEIAHRMVVPGGEVRGEGGE